MAHTKDLLHLVTCQECDGVLHLPRILECTHMYCEQCVLSLKLIRVRDDMGYHCPQCGVFTNKNDVKESALMNSLVELHHSQKHLSDLDSTHLHVCGECALRKSTWKCLHCKQEVCSSCKHSHDEKAPPILEQILSIEDDVSAGVAPAELAMNAGRSLQQRAGVSVDGISIDNNLHDYGSTANSFVPVVVHWDSSGLDLSYDGDTLASNLATPGFVPAAGDRFAFSGRTGGANQNTYIDDLVEGIFRLISAVPPLVEERGETEERDTLSPVAPWRVVNIGNGSPTKLMDFVEALEAELGQKAERNYMDMQPGDVHATWADTALLTALVGALPRTELRDGIAQFVTWFRGFNKR